MKNRPKLSICIPTYNRPKFVEHCLRHIIDDLHFPFPFEIVISDNSSSEETCEIVKKFRREGLNISYMKQNYTTPAYHNHCAALRNARGEYAVYMSDDDYIISDSLLQAITYMDNNPSVTATFTSYEIYDALTETTLSREFTVQEDMVFSKDNFLATFNFFLTSGFRPEVGLYRTDILGSMIIPRTFNAPSFVHLAHLVQIGSIYIPERPFYRFVIRSALNPNQSHEGVHWARKLWNQEVGGIEELFFVMSQTTGIQLDASGKATLGYLLDSAELVRLISAMSLCTKAGDYLEAYELFVRIKIIMIRHSISMDAYPQVRDTAKLFYGRVEIDAVVQALSTTTNIKNIVIYGIAEKGVILALLQNKETSTKYSIVFSDDLYEMDNYNSPENFVITSSDANIRALSEIGFCPGLIASIESLTRRYSISFAI